MLFRPKVHLIREVSIAKNCALRYRARTAYETTSFFLNWNEMHSRSLSVLVCDHVMILYPLNNLTVKTVTEKRVFTETFFISKCALKHFFNTQGFHLRGWAGWEISAPPWTNQNLFQFRLLVFKEKNVYVYCELCRANRTREQRSEVRLWMHMFDVYQEFSVNFCLAQTSLHIKLQL